MRKKYFHYSFFCFSTKLIHRKTSSELSERVKEERSSFFNMLLKVQQKRPHFNAKRVMKKLYPDYFS